MIISRAPYRVSFFGGGTDYPAWYEENGGQVLSTTINHYCYISCRYLPPFFEFKNRISWSQIELVNDNDAINHPVIKAALNHLRIYDGMEIHCQGDLPARAGLGSSSSFTVSLLNALYALQKKQLLKKELAKEAIFIERELLKEAVGVQDQIATSFGGFNKIKILPNGEFRVLPTSLPQLKLDQLQNHLLLFFTGVVRSASDIAKSKIQSIPNNKSTLKEMHEMVDLALNILEAQNIEDFGKLLHESWLLKKSLSSGISSNFIDSIYTKAMSSGAIGGKILGAGGGGFILFFVKPENHFSVLEALKDLLYIPFKFETEGASILFRDESVNFSISSKKNRDYTYLNDKKLTFDAESY